MNKKKEKRNFFELATSDWIWIICFLVVSFLLAIAGILTRILWMGIVGVVLLFAFSVFYAILLTEGLKYERRRQKRMQNIIMEEFKLHLDKEAKIFEKEFEKKIQNVVKDKKDIPKKKE